ncbi:MAG: hypothetical protein LBD48_01715 [Treponema sp.]|jgi:hypothetical protein|nr:hypothetical protein [Treponema sp.]
MRIDKMNTSVINNLRLRRGVIVLVMVLLTGPVLWAAARKDKIEGVTAEGGEIWQNNYDVSGRKTGKYNFIVNAQDHAGNTSVSGPFNVFVDPKAGLPLARVVFPETGSILRQNINLLGVASGRFGVSRVTVRLDSGEPVQASGTEYWSLVIDVANVPEGKHTIYTEAYDSKGMSGGMQSVTFILDKAPPALDLTSHQIGDLISGNVTVKGAASDPNGLAQLLFSEDGKLFRPLGKVKKGTSLQTFSFEIKTKSMADGPVVYYVRAVDTTGLVSTKPFLFFVDNKGPELELLGPAEGDDVFGKFMLSGRVYDAIGLSRMYYEWGGHPVDIEIRPGDPFWGIELDAGLKPAGTIKVTAVDKSGNTVSVTKKLEDRRKVKTPVLVIDYPPQAVLNAMPPDAAIYGHIAPGIEPQMVHVPGIGDIEARSSFRIAPDQIPQGKSTLKMTPRGADNSTGAAVSLKVSKLAAGGGGALSAVTVTSPVKYAWVSGPSVALQGTVSGSAQLEYRLGPEDTWRSLTVGAGGRFNADISIAQLPEGPLHLELRARNGDIPVYHPLNRAASTPDFRFIAPTADGNPINGNVTVLAEIASAIPIVDISYTLDGRDYDDIPFISRYGTTWLNYFCDFTALNATGRKLVLRVTDASGAVFDRSPEFRFDAAPDIPVIIVNTPEDGDVVTEAFNISGVAFDDDAVQAVYWRLLGPKPESIPAGPAGDQARARAAAFAASPNIPFQKLSTSQNFQIPVDFPDIIDGEYTLEAYAEDLYGVKSQTASRIIKVSSAPPETRIVEPEISRYNRKVILVKGFSSDANGISFVSLSMDNGNTFQRARILQEGNWELALNTTTYRDGIYSALIRTEDNYGITSFVNAMINIDNTPPELDLSSPGNGQHVGTDLQLMGRVQDNVTLKSLSFQIISAVNPSYQRKFDIPPQLVIFESMSLAGFPQGEYIIRIAAQDLADNESIISRKIVYDADDAAAEIAIFNPLPGEIHAGPLNLVGSVSGSFVPQQVTLKLNGEPAVVDVDRYGVFHYSIPEAQLANEPLVVLSATYNSETGKPIDSPKHTVHYSPYGPSLVIESHQDGDYITKRPWLSGQAWIKTQDPAEGGPVLTRKERAELNLKQVQVSYDNGRSFRDAIIGGNQWKFRLETATLTPGPQPVVVRAVFANGEETVRRLLLVVDTIAPTVVTISPPEESIHRDDLLIYGTATDNFELSNVDIGLRPRDKFWYSVPGPIQGLYLDAKVFGATWFDVGLGLTLFKDNVRFQAQFGLAPGNGVEDLFATGGRFIGQVYGFKLLANIFYLPFDYLFGPDWAFYSWRVALGVNFSYFTMGDGRNPAWIGAIVGQWEFANIDLQFFYPNWKYFHNFSLYFEPEFWFISSDVQASTEFRATLGLRWNFF